MKNNFFPPWNYYKTNNKKKFFLQDFKNFIIEKKKKINKLITESCSMDVSITLFCKSFAPFYATARGSLLGAHKMHTQIQAFSFFLLSLLLLFLNKILKCFIYFNNNNNNDFLKRMIFFIFSQQESMNSKFWFWYRSGTTFSNHLEIDKERMIEMTSLLYSFYTKGSSYLFRINPIIIINIVCWIFFFFIWTIIILIFFSWWRT